MLNFGQNSYFYCLLRYLTKKLDNSPNSESYLFMKPVFGDFSIDNLISFLLQIFKFKIYSGYPRTGTPLNCSKSLENACTEKKNIALSKQSVPVQGYPRASQFGGIRCTVLLYSIFQLIIST